MARTVLRAHEISKSYRVGGPRRGYQTFRESLMDLARGPIERARNVLQGRPVQAAEREFQALRGVSFSIDEGELVGIIGHNGAGKSTLLKIISRVTEPTAGHLETNGRVGSLLEVGTGFHPELTGRENIYLSGAILGMKRSEIKACFDEIVSFSEIGDFLDTPVKRYSSGMYVRLAFAVASHLESDILLVDEVLAVGDIGFQKKCLERMARVAKQGRTVLFVSHSMASIQAFTNRAIVLRAGEVDFDGPTPQAIEHYLRHIGETTARPLSERTDRTGTEHGVIRNVNVTIQGKPAGTVALTGMPLEVHITYETRTKGSLDFFLAFYDIYGRRIAHLNSILTNMTSTEGPRSGVATCTIHKFCLTPGRYTLAVAVDCNGETLDRVENVYQLDVAMGDFFGTGRVTGSDWGSVLIEHEWRAGP